MFRFTIRDVLWLTVVVAMGLGWYSDRLAVRREWESLRAERESLAEQKRQQDAQSRWLVQAWERYSPTVHWPTQIQSKAVVLPSSATESNP